MAIVNSVVLLTPGQGSPLLQSRAGVALTDGANALVIPSSGSLAPTLKVGTIRIKVYSGTGTSPVLSAITVTATDGTTTETVLISSPSFALTANKVYDMVKDFIVDIAATSVTVTLTLTGTSEGATTDLELAYSN